MRQQRRAIIGVADRWSVFFDKLGWGDDQAWMDSIRRHGFSRSFFVSEIWSHYVLSRTDPPQLESRSTGRELAAKNDANFIILIGAPDHTSMRNWIFVPPQTRDELERYTNPMYLSRGQHYSGWYLGNFADGPDGEVVFSRLEADPLRLGQSDGGSVFDAFVASMALRR